MKTRIFFGIVGIAAGLLTGSVRAQIHLSGQRFVDVQAGTADGFRPGHDRTGLHGLVSTGRYNRHYNAWVVTGGYGQYRGLAGSSSAGLPGSAFAVGQYTLGYGYEFNLWRNATRTAFVRGLVQPFVGYESVNRDRPVSGTATDSTASGPASRFLAGGDIGLAIEVSPVVIGLRQRWRPTANVQRFHTLFFIGWRFHR